MVDVGLLLEELKTVRDSLERDWKGCSADAVDDSIRVIRSYWAKPLPSARIIAQLKRLEHPGMSADQLMDLNDAMFHICEQDRKIEASRLVWTYDRPKVVGRYHVRKNKQYLGIVYTDLIVSGKWLWLPSYECAGPIPDAEEPDAQP